MAGREKGGKVVFIGNIPYGVSEEQIMEIFGQVGKVVSFRLVYDKETGKPKGFGFLEYTDVDAAASACRNLNGYEIMGRSLKVDYSNDNSGGGGQRNQNQNQPPPAHYDGGHGMPGMGQPAMNGGAQPDSAQVPPLPQGTNLPPGLSAADAISKTLSTLPPPQLLDIISQMKGLVTTQPQQATAILNQAPQLGFAIFQALLLLGLVQEADLAMLVQYTNPQQAPPSQPPMPPAPYQQQPAYPPGYGQPPPAQQPQYPPQPQYQQHPGYVNTPPVQQPAYHPPPPQPQAPPPQAQDASHQAAIQQVLALTREQIYAMEPTAREQILQVRAQLGAPVS